MAHDKNGSSIEKGDLVSVPCKVVAVHDGHGYSVVLVEPAIDGANVKVKTFGLNPCQVELLRKKEESCPAA